jgi:hypothetical protein
MFDRIIVRDETRSLTWFVTSSWNPSLKHHSIEPFSSEQADELISKFSSNNINCFKEPHKNGYWSKDYPYHVLITFDNEADEAAFVLQNS